MLGFPHYHERFTNVKNDLIFATNLPKTRQKYSLRMTLRCCHHKTPENQCRTKRPKHRAFGSSRGFQAHGGPHSRVSQGRPAQRQKPAAERRGITKLRDISFWGIAIQRLRLEVFVSPICAHELQSLQSCFFN